MGLGSFLAAWSWCVERHRYENGIEFHFLAVQYGYLKRVFQLILLKGYSKVRLRLLRQVANLRFEFVAKADSYLATLGYLLVGQKGF